ncbi:HAD superfamily hydrolase (TIGR01450 family) [Haloactinospora alba]|uniref:HAD superfamily hydrolase (TIGR01450 family) n=1 Tax=Haloactinospora alba TaxID=405555 RepID=A0A543NHL5_9ACTN|nr:HAD-IIA family hydrolase [Haloactinospora alba]TQN31299.1 HAD superfamily hydrolase (TIGR01450 family) [Haloactinospora alba]
MALLSSDRPLNSTYDAALLDLDGVVYLGSRPVPEAPEAVRTARGAGMRIAFVTNNASRTPAATAERLTAMGIEAVADEVVTSAEAASRLVAKRFPAGSPVLVVGDTGVRVALRVQGLRPVSAAAEHPVAVVQGYSPRMSTDLLGEGMRAVSRGALFVTSNNDATAPGAEGAMPGNGSLARVIAHATGKEPIVAGKPEPPLHEEGVQRTGAVSPIVVGDRLDTDIEGAHARGAASLLVLSGVTSPSDVVHAPQHARPSYLASDLTGLNTPHPPTYPDGDGGMRCGGWTAAVRGGEVELTGNGERLDALRALCGAVWEAAREGVGSPKTIAALHRLGY